MDYNISMTLTGHQNNGSNNYVVNGKILLFTVILLFIVIAVLAALHTYLRWFCNRRRRSRLPRRLLLFSSGNAAAGSNSSVATQNQALDVCVLKTIPTFVYSETHKDRFLECAVCLCEFERNEKGRVLPKCNHAFHVDCIDMWFQSHSNCPLCRAPVQAINPVQSPVEATGSGNGSGEAEVGCSSRDLPHHLELVSILVEVPRGNPRNLDDLGLGSGSPDSNGFKSSGNRVLTLKRLWSV